MRDILISKLDELWAQAERLREQMEVYEAKFRDAEAAYEAAMDLCHDADRAGQPDPNGTVRVHTVDGWVEWPRYAESNGWAVVLTPVPSFSLTHIKTGLKAGEFRFYADALELMETLAREVPNADISRPDPYKAVTGPDAERAQAIVVASARRRT